MFTMETGNVRHLLVGAVEEGRERMGKVTSELVDKGKKAEVRDKKDKPSEECRAEKEIPTMEDLTDMIGRTVERFLGQMGLMTKGDMESLERRIGSMERKMDRLMQEKKPPAAKKTK